MAEHEAFFTSSWYGVIHLWLVAADRGGHGGRQLAMAAKPVLYNSWISSCSHRVRIALNLKGLHHHQFFLPMDQSELRLLPLA